MHAEWNYRSGFSPTPSLPTEQIDVVCAADDAYAMPLAVTLKSASAGLSSPYRLRVWLLDGGISSQNGKKLEQTLDDCPVELHVVRPDLSSVADLDISHHISHTAYFRLLTAELLPSDVRKVIYLDSDLLIIGDLAQLWTRDVDDHYCLASPDIACPYIDARKGCANVRSAGPYMASLKPVPNYKELGMDGTAEYFNSGVMVLNLERWRRENVAEGLLKTLRDHRRYVWCWDQYALNVLFHQNWGRIEPRWNQGTHAFAYPQAEQAPIDLDEWLTMKSDPAIIHYTTEFKPWHRHSKDPRPEFFYTTLAGTAWESFDPNGLSPSLRRWANLQWAGLMKNLTISSRRIAFAWT